MLKATLGTCAVLLITAGAAVSARGAHAQLPPVPTVPPTPTLPPVPTVTPPPVPTVVPVPTAVPTVVPLPPVPGGGGGSGGGSGGGGSTGGGSTGGGSTTGGDTAPTDPDGYSGPPAGSEDNAPTEEIPGDGAAADLTAPPPTPGQAKKSFLPTTGNRRLMYAFNGIALTTLAGWLMMLYRRRRLR
jgi:hypothetical protein